MNGSLRTRPPGNAETPWISEAYEDCILINGKLTPFLDVEDTPAMHRFPELSMPRTRPVLLSGAVGRITLATDRIGSGVAIEAGNEGAGHAGASRTRRCHHRFQQIAGPGAALAKPGAATEAVSRGAPRPFDAPSALPTTLRAVPRIHPGSAVRTRRLTLNNYEDPSTHMMMMLLNATYWHQPVTEKPLLGSVEIWEFVNLTEDTHPIHLHLVRFQVLDRHRFDVDEFLLSGKMVPLGDPCCRRG